MNIKKLMEEYIEQMENKQAYESTHEDSHTDHVDIGHADNWIY